MKHQTCYLVQNYSSLWFVLSQFFLAFDLMLHICIQILLNQNVFHEESEETYLMFQMLLHFSLNLVRHKLNYNLEQREYN